MRRSRQIPGAKPDPRQRSHGTRCASALLLHPHDAARGVSPPAPSQIPLQHPRGCAAPKPRGSSSRSPAQSRLIASCLFFFAFEVRIPPTLARARFCPVSHGEEPVVTQIQGHGRVAKPSPARVWWEQHPRGQRPAGTAATGTAAALPRVVVVGFGGILHSRHLLLSYLIPPEPGTGRGAGAAGAAASGHRERPRRRCGDRQSHQQATHPGFVLASRGVKALGEEVSLFKLCLREGAAFFISQDSLKFRKREREREREGTAKGRD